MELDDLFGWADVVTVHAPELPSTRHLVNAERLARMHDGAWLVNTARGSIVDTEALTKECVAGRLCAFIDTPDPEPLPPDSPLYDLPNVVLTPHIAGSLGTEISRMGDLAVAEVRRFLAGEPLRHEVRRRGPGAHRVIAAPTVSTIRARTRWRATRSRPRTTCGGPWSTSSSPSSPTSPPAAHGRGSAASGRRSRRGSPSWRATRGRCGASCPSWPAAGPSRTGTGGRPDSPTAPTPTTPSTGARAATAIDQRMVEMAAIGFALAFTPEHLWDPLTGRQRDHVVEWLRGIERGEPAQNNWQFFRLLVQMGLERVGVAIDREAQARSVALLDSFAIDRRLVHRRGGRQRRLLRPVRVPHLRARPRRVRVGRPRGRRALRRARPCVRARVPALVRARRRRVPVRPEHDVPHGAGQLLGRARPGRRRRPRLGDGARSRVAPPPVVERRDRSATATACSRSATATTTAG